MDNSISRTCRSCGRETNKEPHNLYCIVGTHLDNMQKVIVKLEGARDWALAHRGSLPHSEFATFSSMAYEVNSCIIKLGLYKDWYEAERCDIPMRHTWGVDNIPDWVKTKSQPSHWYDGGNNEIPG